MIDPGYIPEDLTQYLLNYSGNEEELICNSCDDAKLYGADSNDYDSIFIPPYVSTPRELPSKQEDQESFQDSGMPEDESDSDLSPLQNKAKKKIHDAPNPDKLKLHKENSKPLCQQKTAKKLQSKSDCISAESDKNIKNLTKSSKKKSSEKSKNANKVTTAFDDLCHFDKSKKASSTSIEILQDVTSISNKSRSKKNVMHKDNFDVASEDTLNSKTSSKISARKLPLSSDKTQGNSPLSKKKKKATNLEEIDITLAAHPNQGTGKSVAMEIIGDISSSGDKSEVIPQSNTNISNNQGIGNNCQNDTKEHTRKITSISVDSSSTEETENHSSGSSRKKVTRSTSKAKKICTMPPEDTQDDSAFLFNPSEEMVTYLRKNKNKNVPLRVHNESSNSSKPKASSTDKAESRKEKTKDKRNSSSPQGKKSTAKRAKTPKKSLTRRDCNGKVISCPKKNTSVMSSPNTSNATQAERHKMYREKKRKYFEDLEKEIESLRTENENLKRALKVNNNVSNSNEDITEKGMGSDTKDFQYDKGNLQMKNKQQENTNEMSLFIEDLKEEIRQLQREKKNLISIEDIESIVNDLKEEISQLRKQKKDLEIKGKERDLVVCGLRQEREGRETQRNSMSTVKDFIDKIPALQEEKNELKSKAKEMELFIENLKNDKKDLTAEKEEFLRSNEEMKLLVNKSKEEIKALKKSRDEIVSNEKGMKLNLNDLIEKLDGLKKQNDDHENNAIETDSVMKRLREELGELKTEKAVVEGNAKEMATTIKNLKNEISVLKEEKKEEVSKFESMKREKVNYKSSEKEMNSLISSLKGEIIKLEKEKAASKSSVKELECMTNNLNDEISNLKTEIEVQKTKLKEMGSIIKDLTNEKKELQVELKNKDVSIAQELKEKPGQALIDNEETVGFLGKEDTLLKNTDAVGKKLSSLSDKDYGEELKQLQKGKEELKQNGGKLNSILKDMKSELDQLKNEKEKYEKNSEKMVTVVHSMKEDLEKLKCKEKDICDDVKEYQSRKEKGNCLTAEDMSYFVKDLKEEIGYLKGLIINQSELSALMKHVGTFPGFESSEQLTSGKRKLESVSDNTGNESKRQKSGNGEEKP